MATAMVPPTDIDATVNMLYACLHPDSYENYIKYETVNGVKATNFSLQNCKNQGLTIKDILAPDYLKFTNRYFQVNDKYGQAFFISDLSTQLPIDIRTILNTFTIVEEILVAATVDIPYME